MLVYLTRSITGVVYHAWEQSTDVATIKVDETVAGRYSNGVWLV